MKKRKNKRKRIEKKIAKRNTLSTEHVSNQYGRRSVDKA